jgi:hypothetical protein
MSTDVITPQIGDSVYLTTVTGNLVIRGVISDLDSPDQVSGSLEVDGPNMLLSLRAIQGPPGRAGDNAPIWDLQQQIFNDPDDLPDNLTDEDADIGKLFMVRQFDEDGNAVSTRAYIWYGTRWEWFIMGYAGPAGPVPIISWTVETLDPDDPDAVEEVIPTGDTYFPSLHLKIRGYRGPVGPSTNIADAPDVDFTTPPETGDFLMYDGTNWIPAAPALIRPRFYTVPEAAFTDVAVGFGTTVQICSWEIPEQEWDVVPYVDGHVRILGVELDADPFIIGAQVRLGHPTSGTLLARGFGNITTYCDITPHTSTASAPNDAIAPGNGRGVIPAGTTGAAATLYVSAFNEGLAGTYSFNKTGAQLSVVLYAV